MNEIFMNIGFWVLGITSVVASLFMVTRENPVHSALWMLLTFFAVAGIFIQLDAEYIAAIQVMVYAGAILVLYMFVVMLLNPKSTGFIKLPVKVILGAVVALVLFFQIVMTLMGTGVIKTAQMTGINYPEGLHNVKAFGAVMFTQYIVPFEIASVLLLVAMIGAIVIAKKD
ncbi:NADH-quinone oxidoreductase subunit J [Seleniivibrio woodruffii]|mgnify:CR=1 FL=1|uniref:NADH-quinone oxidoreductase subunit J n=1 Tax=Seleniivibrio woodruffii TaxID=1078050 RepID=A0A4R1KAW1_9BACT|nr:NADH-quinone oxidoreductase subunit J [Seleniivibrio woodruffii]TCK61582.1 NADH dehydrogenase subunit J [Seleniivibrio woodruffii]TVZ35303.1 NADH dehydrogenase subunit J [Seleniivibrio woodruffii]